MMKVKVKVETKEAIEGAFDETISSVDVEMNVILWTPHVLTV